MEMTIQTVLYTHADNPDNKIHYQPFKQVLPQYLTASHLAKEKQAIAQPRQVGGHKSQCNVHQYPVLHGHQITPRIAWKQMASAASKSHQMAAWPIRGHE